MVVPKEGKAYEATAPVVPVKYWRHPGGPTLLSSPQLNWEIARYRCVLMHGMPNACTLVPIPILSIIELKKSWSNGDYGGLIKATSNWKRQSYGSVNGP